MNLTIQEIAQAVGSECSALTKITNVEFDSRKITEGSLFVPLVGTRDGHEFIQQAITNGASASFWSLPVEQAPKDFPVIPVADPLKAMQQLATYYLEKVGAEVVAITGSNGKTTTKDLTASVLSENTKHIRRKEITTIILVFLTRFCTCRKIQKKSFWKWAWITPMKSQNFHLWLNQKLQQSQ